MNNDFSTVIAAMSVEEKVALLTGSGLWRTASMPQHGIPDIVMTDGTYGVRYSSAQIDGNEKWSMDDFISVITQTADQASADEPVAKGGSEALFSASLPATCFPNGSSLACSWDVELVREMGEALGRECQQMGVGILLGPGINIRRTPLAGRGYEYYSEDPVVSGDIAAALINGLQAEGVGASLKHFAANNSEYRRTEMDSIIEERALREIYLAGFQRAIAKSQPWTVMSSYNRLNGVQTSQDPFLLTQVLRDEWGYDGLVMSDWYGIKDRPASLLAGNDLAMPETRRDKQTLLAAISCGEVPMPVVDRACLRMLELVDKVQRHRRPHTRADFAAHHALSQRLAAESIVLLKNEDNLLPLKPHKTPRIAVIGKPAQEPVIQGSGCATTVPYLLDRPLDEIFDLAGDDFKVTWAPGAPDDNQSDEQALAQARDVAGAADVAVIFVSTAVGEDGENGDRQDLNILPAHEQLIREVAGVQPNVVVVLANSDAVVMPWLGECRALLETFFAGQGMGRAVAEILFGKRNPCGKLTVTVPNTLEETPAWLQYPGENLRHHYGEGLFVGYRYYDKRLLSPRFPFGFGLSYTQFSYANLALSASRLAEGETLRVAFDLTNIGDCEGKEIVQLYVTAPKGELIREVRALKAFSKVSLLAGETRRVELALPVADLACYHPGLADWLVTPGQWQIYVGASSRDLPLTASVEIDCPARYVPLRDDNSLQQLIQQPEAFARVVALISAKSGVAPDLVREKLIRLAPDLFCGLLIALTEFLALDIDRDELNAVLAGH
ncbi:TPA: beta-glucosidase family protein [Klebsiella aerogenes]|uniref:beta-glucosidase family protein n=1 Tax=Klebsiella aerogenes TaxID=548 RepID=UPI000447DB66|nr:glycoside hydrolase family 3 C-terminal domain-containing protein [Klebsiella aerogenes]EIV6705309.1 glycoside hydrolase family 3 C-terminal domain-containing protein [Klebsiella aerogenes]EIV9525959.1 glycosyl hydrolase [Klebsiella aerogenes]EIW8604694.1 glycoside hydrolase family 3 C-terminal domain-containing protein [Klebsiella aerogenes]EKU8837374.1 glycoside hydrolase family 3 C-terminal domain-containing protein [Klebsiella aerogenes]EKV6366726.1 glycoside hydrolase family 3 C-termin